MKRLVSMLLVLMLLLVLAPSAAAAEGVTQLSGIGGGPLVSVDMTGRTGDVVLANGFIASDMAASSMVGGSVAAINGGFFNSYYTGQGNSFPGNCPIIYGVVVKNGRIVNGGGSNNAIAFTYDGKVLIDRVEFRTTAIIQGKANVALYGINKVYQEASSVTLMTKELGLPFTAPAGAQVFTIQNDKITGVNGAGTYMVPAGCSLLVYNSGAVANAQRWENLPAVGDTVQFATSCGPTTASAEWNNVKTAIAGGRMLVQNGVNVTASAAYNAEFDSDPKQSNTGAMGRSFAAVTADGKLLLGTGSGSFPQIADALIARGAVNAVSLDGGASSMLYADGAMLTPAGRELASVLVVVPQNPNEVRPVNPVIPVIDNSPNKPSAWAAASVEEAKGLSLLPDWLLNNYRNPVTREEFCDLIFKLIPARTGKTTDQFRGELGVVGEKYSAIHFTDTSKYSILQAAALGIVNGYEDGAFRPDQTLTRQEAAAMLQRAADLMGTVQHGAGKSFADAGAIAGWAQSSVEYVTTCGIMNGTDKGFEPQGSYTREQAFITMLNTYRAVTPK